MSINELVKIGSTWVEKIEFGINRRIPCLSYSPSGERLAVGDSCGTFWVLDAASNQTLSQISFGIGEIVALAYIGDDDNQAEHVELSEAGQSDHRSEGLVSDQISESGSGLRDVPGPLLDTNVIMDVQHEMDTRTLVRNSLVTYWALV